MKRKANFKTGEDELDVTVQEDGAVVFYCTEDEDSVYVYLDAEQVERLRAFLNGRDV